MIEDWYATTTTNKEELSFVEKGISRVVLLTLGEFQVDLVAELWGCVCVLVGVRELLRGNKK